MCRTSLEQMDGFSPNLDIDPILKVKSQLTKVEFIAKIEKLLEQMYG